MTERDRNERIHPSLASLAVPIASLVADPRNARLYSERNLRSIEDSLKAHGQRKPIVVQLPGRVVRAGNGTMEAAQRLGWTHLAAVMVEESDAEALAFAIRDNRTAELATWDYGVLGDLLTDLAPLVEDFAVMGFDAVEMDGLRSAGFWDDVPNEAAENGAPVVTRWLTLRFDEQQAAELAKVTGEEKPTPAGVLAALGRTR